MNITLSAEEQLVRRTRQFARERGTSLNQLIRDYMEHLASLSELQADAEEFARLARTQGGAAPGEFVFNRDEIHHR